MKKYLLQLVDQVVMWSPLSLYDSLKDNFEVHIADVSLSILIIVIIFINWCTKYTSNLFLIPYNLINFFFQYLNLTDI